jgi:hypothetical protein
LIDLEAAGIALTIDFGSLGNSADYKLSGWQEPERGFTWTLGNRSTLTFPCPDSPGRYALELQVSPFVWKDKLATQRIIVTVNEDEVGRFGVEHDAVLSCEIPWAVLFRRDACIVEFQLPDSAKPIDVNGVPDTRSLAIAFDEVRLVRIGGLKNEATGPTAKPRTLPTKPATDADLKALMMRFESLGEDCEFGLVQRRCGAEPLGLLRFSSTPLPKLTAAIYAKFEGLGRPDMLKVDVSSNGREYMVLDKRFGLYYHAWVKTGEKTPEEIHARECSRLPFLARKLVEDLQSGEKIFVYRGMKPLPERQVLHLVASMRESGPTTLLWVELADNDNTPGTVEEVAPGLFKGYIERFAPANNAHEFSLEAWVDVCHNAECLRRALGMFAGNSSSK